MALGGVHRNQLWKERVQPIQKSLQISLKTSSISEKKNESDGTVGGGVRVLEIGTWFGKGSTELILNLMPKDAEVFLVDSWTEYVRKELIDSYKAMDSVHHIAHQSTIKNVQKYERMNKDITVNIFRGKTRNILPLLPSEYFDFIYIDGSHYYDEISFDLREALRLVKSAGVICGDDLEVLPTAPIVEVLQHHKNQDIFNLDGDVWVHPGVALALYESGLSIEIENGHWRMLKI